MALLLHDMDQIPLHENFRFRVEGDIHALHVVSFFLLIIMFLKCIEYTFWHPRKISPDTLFPQCSTT